MGYVILFIVLIVAAVIGTLVWQAGMRRKMSNAVHQMGDFRPTQEVMSEDGSTGLAVDEGAKKICLIRNTPRGVDCQVIGYDKIICSEVIENGTTITKTSRGSQIGGALAGGLLFGGVGAVVGGLSGSKRTKSKIKQLALRVTINDTARPTHQVNFLSSECSQGDIVYNAAMGKASHWHGLLDAAVKQAESRVAASPHSPSPAISVAGEIKKLAELCDSGILTEEEFQKQKQKLLG